MSPQASAASVSAFLRREGFHPTSDRKREGVRVAEGVGAGNVIVRIDFDSNRRTAEFAVIVTEALTRGGYTILDCTSNSSAIFIQKAAQPRVVEQR